MKIITRRFGSHFGYTYSRNKGKIKFYIILFLVITVVFYLLISLRSHFMPVAVSMAEAKARAIGTVIVNEAVTQQLSSNNLSYSQLFDIQKNSSGEISAITANVEKMNLIKTQLTSVIQERINGIDTQQIGIPLGNILNNELLAGRGPKIPVKLVTLGVIKIDFSNSFVSAGINQTKHEVQLDINVQISAMLPAGDATADVNSVIPIAQTIIVGKVPDAYANISF